MQTVNQSSKTMIIVGWVLSGLVILMLLADAIGKLIKPDQVVKSTMALGYPESVITGLGIILFISTILYAIPTLSLVGAILLTAYLGGAVATHIRIGSPLFSHTLFPVYIGLALWAGLYLRNEPLRHLISHVNLK